MLVRKAIPSRRKLFTKINKYSGSGSFDVNRLKTTAGLTPANKRFLLSLGLRIKKSVNKKRKCYRKY